MSIGEASYMLNATPPKTLDLNTNPNPNPTLTKSQIISNLKNTPTLKAYFVQNDIPNPNISTTIPIPNPTSSFTPPNANIFSLNTPNTTNANSSNSFLFVGLGNQVQQGQ